MPRGACPAASRPRHSRTAAPSAAKSRRPSPEKPPRWRASAAAPCECCGRARTSCASGRSAAPISARAQFDGDRVRIDGRGPMPLVVPPSPYGLAVDVHWEQVDVAGPRVSSAMRSPYAEAARTRRRRARRSRLRAAHGRGGAGGRSVARHVRRRPGWWLRRRRRRARRAFGPPRACARARRGGPAPRRSGAAQLLHGRGAHGPRLGVARGARGRRRRGARPHDPIVRHPAGQGHAAGHDRDR